MPRNLDIKRRIARDFVYNRRKKIIAHYSEGLMECACCGEDEYDFLVMDHINNDGAEHKRAIGLYKLPSERHRSGGGSVDAWIKKNNYPPGFQVLCANCNTSKGKKGTCIHKRQEIAQI